MSKFIETWEHIARHLLTARSCLCTADDVRVRHNQLPVGPLHGTVEEFDFFLDSNEFELAWDAIASAGKRLQAGHMFWTSLAEAALLMKDTEKVRHANEMAGDADGVARTESEKGVE